MLELGVEIPGAGGLDGVLHAGLLLEDLLHLLGRHLFGKAGVDLVEAGQERPRGGHALLDVAKDRLGGIERGLLRQIPDAIPRRQRRLALNVEVEAGHDLEQRGLARPVRAKHADLGAVQKREVDVFENDGVGWVDLPEPLHGVDE